MNATKLQQNNEADKQLFVGIDVHKKSWKVTMRTDLFVHKTFTQSPDSVTLVRYIKKNFPDYQVTCAYEAGFSGYWLHRALEKENIQCLVVNPADIPTTDKENKYKEDKRDSRKIAKQLKNGDLEGIFVPDHRQEQLRSFFRQRNTVVKDLRRQKSRIKSLLNYYGIVIPEKFKEGCWSKNFIRWVQELKKEHPTFENCTASMVRQLEFLRKEKLIIERSLKEYIKAKYKNDYELLVSVPGIGPIVAITILAEIGDIRRFKKADELFMYIGLVPSTYSSGDKEAIKGITPRSKAILRSYLIESSWKAVRIDNALQDYYRERIKTNDKKDKNKTIVKVCRKLVNRIYHVIKTGEPYCNGMVQ